MGSFANMVVNFHCGVMDRVIKRKGWWNRQGDEIDRVIKFPGDQIFGDEISGGEISGDQISGDQISGDQYAAPKISPRVVAWNLVKKN